MSKVYNELRQKVYSIIYPDGILIEPWCEIGYIADEETSISYEKIMYRLPPCSFMIPPWPIQDIQIKENLWPDLSLQDILRAMLLKDVFWKLIQDWSWEFLLLWWPTENREYIVIEWQKKPKDREEETLQDIYNLLDNSND